MTADAVGGVWQYSLDLAAGLAQRGAHVLLAVLGPHSSAEQKRRALQIPNLTLVESNFRLEWMADPWADVDAASDWLLNAEAAFGAHVIHLNGYSHAVLAWRKPVIVTAHSCIFSWWQAVHGCAPGPDWSEYHSRVTAGLTAADAIVAPSAYMAGAIAQNYGVTGDKMRVIHNFSRTPRSRAKAKQDYILAAGRFWDEAKNLRLLTRVAPHLDWEVRVAGSEQSAGVGDGLRFLGVLPYSELIQQMSRAAVFAHPALYEPFGLSVLEAARARCCLVLADIASLRELWDGAAVFVDPRDPDRWIFELNALARDAMKRQKLGQLAISRTNRYRPAPSVNQYVALYQDLLVSASRGRREVAA